MFKIGDTVEIVNLGNYSGKVCTIISPYNSKEKSWYVSQGCNQYCVREEYLELLKPASKTITYDSLIGFMDAEINDIRAKLDVYRKLLKKELEEDSQSYLYSFCMEDINFYENKLLVLLSLKARMAEEFDEDYQ